MLVNLHHILPKARAGHYAIPACNINNLETAQGIIKAAHALKSPIILQTSEGAIDYAGMDFIGVIAQMAAVITPVPVVVHLDHGKNIDLVIDAIASGYYSSVMYDGSRLSFEENVRHTKEVVKAAHKKRITVEAELGRIFGKENHVKVTSRQAAFTDPLQAEEFVKKTGCDALAVAVGTAHGAHKSDTKPSLDMRRLKDIASRVSAPLVLHGASTLPPRLIKKLHAQCIVLGDCARVANARGIPASEETHAIKLGVAKINIDTDLRIAFTAAVREVLLNNPAEFDPRNILGPARELVTSVIKEKIKLFGSQGKA